MGPPGNFCSPKKNILGGGKNPKNWFLESELKLKKAGEKAKKTVFFFKGNTGNKVLFFIFFFWGFPFFVFTFGKKFFFSLWGAGFWERHFKDPEFNPGGGQLNFLFFKRAGFFFFGAPPQPRFSPHGFFLRGGLEFGRDYFFLLDFFLRGGAFCF